MKPNKYTEKEIISSNMKDQPPLLLVTATKVETDALHNELAPLPGENTIIIHHKNNLTYYYGIFGKYKAAHVQCDMGSLTRASSIATIIEAISIFKPKVVVMVGIAFGIDDKKQKIGDVLVSEAIIPYNSKRVGRSKTISRSMMAPSSKRLLNRFKNVRTWEHFLPDGTKSTLIPTHILSGEELIDKKSHRDALVKMFPSATGGEMEGAGLYTACDGCADWILVKGICDFADGNKKIDKDKRQNVAAEAAVSVCLEVFSSISGFEEFGMSPVTSKIKPLSTLPDINHKVLFDIYTNNCEKYYIQRDIDHDFQKDIQNNCIWYYGPSGCGKSSVVLRNSLQSNKQFIHINLASCIGLPADDLFKEILYDLSSRVQGIKSQITPKSIVETQKNILSLIDQAYKNIEIYIVIEEIPINSDVEYSEFTQKMCSLVISKSFHIGLAGLKFILSSICNPLAHIQPSQQKVVQHFKFRELQQWNTSDMSKLVKSITSELQILIDKNQIQKIFTAANGSPRFVKKFFRNLISLTSINNDSFNMALSETERELGLIQHV
jgi:nucleoside phosphorylase